MTAKDLKNALLQEAVQGKLVPQIASEGNARDLLEEIRKEKLSHGLDFANAKSGKRKSKKETALAGSNPCDITEEEIPFDIPESWCWCRLSEYLDIRDGTHDSPKFYDNGIPFVTSKNLNDGILDFSTCKYITEEDHKKFSARSFVEDGDILFAMIGSIGNPVIVKKKFDFSFKNMALFKRYTKEKTDMKYIFYYLSYIQFELKRIATGGVQSFIGLGTFREMLFPLPPLAEQKRIVAAIEKFMPLIEEYGKKETQLKAINEKIGTLTKKAILQEAVQGKLVPQNTDEGNAKDLLEEIKKEKAKLIKEGKIKKEKTLPEITEDEMPFDIPENWCWCRLGEIVNKLTDGTHRTPKYVEKGIPFLSVKNLSSGKMDFDNTKFITPEEHKELYARCNPEKGDMLLTKVGTTGIPVINDSDIEFSLFVSVALIKFNHNLLDEKFFLYLLQSPLVQDQAKENTRGVGNKNWVMDAIANTVLVLPPVFEQKRIVETIEKILPLCKKL